MPFPTHPTRAPRPPAFALAPLMLAALAALGCDDTTSGADGDAAPPPCTPGEIGCACDDGACTEGRCADDLCVDCPAGTLRCPCPADGACAEGLVCEQDLCAEDRCPPGALDCPCDGDACDEGLTCMDSTCVPVPECAPGSLDCPCDDDGCAAPLVCINDVCRDCPPDVVGCPCADGACDGGLVCARGACREAIGCADAGCGPFQQCAEAVDGADAACLEACAEGYDWDPAAEACVEQAPTCAAGAPTSIAGQCADQNRTCVEGEGGAACGPCVPGHREDGGACVIDDRANCADDPDDAHSIRVDCAVQQRACVEAADGARCGACLEGLVEDPSTGGCRALDAFAECAVEADCAEGLVCSGRAPADDARCLPPACAEGETFDLGAGACTDRCDCQGPGQTGRPWPVTDWNGDCVCETAAGFFFNTAAGSRRAEPCDADGDGWTRRSAFAHIESPDEAVRLNARCPLRTIDRVLLVNEAGQVLPLTVETLSNGLAQVEPLYETDETDVDAEAIERQEVAYGARRFRAAELNPLTKACVSALDDFNDNGISDVREHHRDLAGGQRAWMATFIAAAYFVELHTGRYQPPEDGDGPGAYVIAERSRCDGALPLTYPADEGPYSASCWRRRDAGYEAAEPLGYDFQRWSCAEPDGACGVQAMPAAARSIDAVPAHGTCDDLDADALGPWRGMGHASQFKCVEVVEDQAPQVQGFQRRRGALRLSAGGEQRLLLNACALTACAEGDAGCVEAVTDEAVNPAQPVVSCETAATDDPAALVGAVGFVTLGFQGYDRTAEYAGGCVSEQAEWPELCPGFDRSRPGATVGVGNPRNGGRIICGCGVNYGGAGCDVGCPDEQLHFGGTAPLDQPGCVDGYCVSSADETGLDGGRLGFWMCGDFTASAFADAPPPVEGEPEQAPAVRDAFHAETPQGVFTVRGHIPTFGTDRAALCEQVDDEGNCAGLILR